MKRYDVIIIGAGAAGLMCAIEAGKRGRKVLLVEHTANIGEKIRISGGGRCNFTNLDVRAENYISNNPHFAVSALKRYTQYDFINLVKKHGVAFHEKTLGQLFCDFSAKLIIEMLLVECQSANVEIKINTKVAEVTKSENFRVMADEKTYESESLVVACGGLSIPKIGATSFGYKIARKFGLNIIPTRAGLVPFVLAENNLAAMKDLIGVSFNGTASCNGKSFSEGIIFTHRGLSGPAVLQISSYWQQGQEIELNFAGGIDVLAKLKELKIAYPRQELKTVLANIMPKKLAAFVSSGMAEKMADLSNLKLAETAAKISHWRVSPIGTEGYRTAEVTLGGVDTDELSSKTFETKKVPGLFFIGEVIDVTGWLGGYNFQWAWSSGHGAGQFV